jgi:hypothetical protein
MTDRQGHGAGRSCHDDLAVWGGGSTTRASIEVGPVAHGRVNRVSQPVYDGVLMTEVSLGASLPGTPVR